MTLGDIIRLLLQFYVQQASGTQALSSRSEKQMCTGAKGFSMSDTC